MADIRNLRQFPIFQSPIMSSTAAAGSSSRPASNSDNACTAGMGNGTNGSKHPGTQNRANVNTNHQSGQMGSKQQQAPNLGQTTNKGGSARGGRSGAPPKPNNNSARPFVSGPNPQTTTRSVSTLAPSPSQNGARQKTNDSWAGDPIYDAEIITIGEGTEYGMTTPTQRTSQSRPGVSPVSRVDLLRNAINTTMQKEMMAQQGTGQKPNGTSSPSPGEKRGYNGPIDQDGEASDPQSYAAVAAADEDKWETQENKRQRRNTGCNVPELFGVKQEPTWDIFVR